MRAALSTDIIRTSFSPPPRSLHLWTFLRVCRTSKTFCARDRIVKNYGAAEAAASNKAKIMSKKTVKAIFDTEIVSVALREGFQKNGNLKWHLR